MLFEPGMLNFFGHTLIDLSYNLFLVEVILPVTFSAV